MTESVNLAQRLYKSFGVLLTLLLFLVGFSIWNFARLSKADKLNIHTFNVLLGARGLHEDLFTLDTGVRAFTTTKDEKQLHGYDEGRAAFETQWASLKALTSDQPSQQESLQVVHDRYQALIEKQVKPIITYVRNAKDLKTALPHIIGVATSRRAAIRYVRSGIKEVENLEQGLLKTRLAHQKALERVTLWTLWLGGLFSVVLTGALVTIVANNSRALDEANRQLLAVNNALEDENLQRRQAEEKLAASVEDLARSNAELEQFAYVASHDLQEPLRAVAGCVQVLQRRYEGKLDARADQFIGHAVEGAQRMQTLIQDLLSFSRVGTKGKPFAPFVGEDLLKNVTQSLSVALTESGAQFTHDLLPEIVGDESQLELVFQNLLSNALKFREEGKTPVIHLGYRREGQNHLFWVQDNGPGIEAQYFERIFVMFQRLHTRSEYPGTGIGLAIVKKIIERHGGKIRVESEAGHGTKFSFFLPVTPSLNP